MTKATDRVRERFLKALAKGATVTEAADSTFVSRQHWYKLRDSDPEFAQAWLDADEQYKDRVRAKLRGWAVDEGLFLETTTTTTEPDGSVTTTHQRKQNVSERLLLAELKRLFPEDYGDQSKVTIEHAGQLNAHITHELSAPPHVLATLENTLLYNPDYQHLAPELLPNVRRALAAIEGEARAIPDHGVADAPA